MNQLYQRLNFILKSTVLPKNILFTIKKINIFELYYLSIFLIVFKIFYYTV